MGVDAASLARKYARAYISYTASYVCKVEDIVKLSALVEFLSTYRDRFFYADKEKYCMVFRSFDLEIDLTLLLDLLIQHKRLFLVRNVLQTLLVLYKKQVGIELCTMKISHEISEVERKQICSNLEQEVGKKIVYSYLLDKKLIAGIRVEGDSFVWEDSIAKKLRIIEQSYQ